MSRFFFTIVGEAETVQEAVEALAQIEIDILHCEGPLIHGQAKRFSYRVLCEEATEPPEVILEDDEPIGGTNETSDD